MQEPNIKINCHSSICINENIFIDPFNINYQAEAKAIFITHSHFDHLDINSIKNILTPNTVIVCTKDSAEILEKAGITNNINIVTPNQTGKVLDISFQTFPSYNFGHHHFKNYGFVGYTLNVNGTTYTICGDTDATPELENVKTDVLLIPIGGIYTMDAEEAAKVTNIIKPKYVIPTHYNYLDDTAGKEGEELFTKLVDKNIKVLIKID